MGDKARISARILRSGVLAMLLAFVHAPVGPTHPRQTYPLLRGVEMGNEVHEAVRKELGTVGKNFRVMVVGFFLIASAITVDTYFQQSDAPWVKWVVIVLGGLGVGSGFFAFASQAVRTFRALRGRT